MLEIAGKQFALTGRFSNPSRKDLAERISAAGGVVRASLSSTTQYLVVGAGAASVAAHAAARGVVTIEPDELLRLLDPLFLLALEEGREHWLDLRTGRIESRLAPSVVDAPRLARREVKRDTIETLLRSAGFRTSHDEDGDIVVQMNGRRTTLVIEATAVFIQFLQFFELNSVATEASKHALANSLNDEWNLVRFHIPSEGRLTADCMLPFDSGLSPVQLITTLRDFVVITADAIKSCGDQGILA